jgi:hypothetical protein
VTRHLSPAELIDLAESAQPTSANGHLASCERCRRLLADAQATMAAAAKVDVPEPSPLFWDHFSARVREAVAAEGAAGRHAWTDAWSWWRLSARWSGGAIAIVALAVAVSIGVGHRRTTPPTDTSAISDTGMLADDPSFDLVADLTADADWDASAADAGLTPHEGAAERAVAQLTDAERRELQRLLEQALRQSGD